MATATASRRPQTATAGSKWNRAKLNHAQTLLTAEQVRKLPPLYSQDGKGMEAVAYVKFFGGAHTYFATEFDAETGRFFGLVYVAGMADQCPNGELGYFMADELIAASVPLNFGNRGTGYARFERDLHFRPQSLRAAFREFTGREMTTGRNRDTAGNDDDFACVVEFNS